MDISGIHASNYHMKLLETNDFNEQIVSYTIILICAD